LRIDVFYNLLEFICPYRHLSEPLDFHYKVFDL
jgi:hypothetical protein